MTVNRQPLTVNHSPRVLHDHPRGCGFRKEGGLYLVSEMSPTGTLPPIVLIEPPIPFEGRSPRQGRTAESVRGEHFRGFVYVDGDQLLARESQDAWWIGPSLDRAIKCQWIEILGMPLSVRMRLGLGKGAKDQVELAERLTALHPPPDSGAFSHYSNAVQAYVFSHGLRNTQADADAADLRRARPAKALALCWSIARQLLWNGSPTPERVTLRDTLARIMTLLGAQRDAVDLMNGHWLEAWRKHATS
jgi:hypothetical protein